jgi:hypothetical protein
MGKVLNKMLKRYDERQAAYANMLARPQGDRQVQRIQQGGYKKPGSRNPRRARG